MAFLNRYLAQKLIYDNHPALDKAHCVRSIQTRHECTACRDICPSRVFDGADPDWGLCTECGLCVSACPARAISFSRITAEQLLSLASHHRGDITLTCRQDVRADSFREMPGALPWELLAFFALQGYVTVITADCAQCANAACRLMLRQNTERTAVFPSGSPFEDNLQVTQDASSGSMRQYTRREAIAHLMKRTGRSATLLLPSEGELTQNADLWRQLLVHRVRQLTASYAVNESGTYSVNKSGDSSGAYMFRWSFPAITDACSACGICTKICPAGALLRAPGPEGSSRFYMAVIPWRCTGCGLCEKICPLNAIITANASVVSDPLKPVLHAVHAVPCRRCGEPVPGGSGSPLCNCCRGGGN